MLSLAARRLPVVLAAAFMSSVALAGEPTLPGMTSTSEPVQVEQKPAASTHKNTKVAKKAKKATHKRHHKKHVKTTAKSAAR